ncbi:Glycosyl transferase family 2 [Pseudobutyrivibrio ruminis]|uniref:Glycosyl transferase family 2 n=2 Tax=Pseudobutyrivibrio ruminis TaxID=46206 RepID=A0A1H7H532_9FIRM|nr:Glycosyl transferase family 2 [Pseudobutyrivibrio ruminis]
MNQSDDSLVTKMNIKTDAIICNQCGHIGYHESIINDNLIKYFDFNEKGVGLNRNNALMRASGDICLFADDDMVYVDNYSELVDRAFNELPKADVIIFNLIEDNSERYFNTEIHRVRWYNYLRYGTARVAVKLKSVKENNIYFNQCFGGGTEHCHGEDNIFLTDCLKKGLKIYAVPYPIAYLKNTRESTWNKGYNDKYIVDQGVLYRTISKRFWKLLCLRDSLVNYKHNYKKGFFEAYRLMTKGSMD